MKKLFFLIATLALLVGCKQEDQVNPESEYITFTNQLVAELTRGDNTVTTSNLNSFDVWGHNDNGVVFAGTRVAKQGESWSYGEKKLWEHSTIYHFHAFAPSGVLSNVGDYPNAERMKGLSDFVYENEGTEDLVYAYATRTQGSPRRINGDPVQFAFKHLLSRVKITYKNDLSDAADVTILATQITDAVKSAQLNVAETKWVWTPKTEGVVALGDTKVISQGEKCATENVAFLFPSESRDYTIEFNLVYESDPEETKTAVLSGVKFEMGTSYNVTIKINDDVVGAEKFNVEFIVEVEEWSDDVELEASVTDKEVGGEEGNGGSNDDGENGTEGENGNENGDESGVENGSDGDNEGNDDENGSNQGGNGTTEGTGGNSTTGGNEATGNQGGSTTTSGNGYENGHAYVDLGLPSGLKWATYNVGANTPEEYGDYFAWGETSPKAVYDWSTYKYGDATTEMTKYCTNPTSGKDFMTDNKTKLEPEDDAATINWGGAWRMPTLSDCFELEANCKIISTTQNGVKGYKVLSPNGNSIFLPEGCVWTASLSGGGCYAAAWYVSGGYSGFVRCKGYPVRPVCP